MQNRKYPSKEISGLSAKRANGVAFLPSECGVAGYSLLKFLTGLAIAAFTAW